MEDRNPSAPRTGGTNRREGINPLYLVTSKSDNCDLSRFAEKCADNMNEASLRSSSEELSKTERPSKVYDGKVDKRQIYLSRTLKTPSTLSSCKTPKVRSTPAMNCTEMIVICVDISKDMGRLFSNSDAKEKCSFIQCVEKALKVFVSNKLNMSASHKFALMFLTNTALWMHDFTSDLHKLMSFVKDVPECNVEDAIDMNDVFEAMMMKYEDDLKLTLSTAAASSAVACSYRLLMIYGRSKCIPQMELQEQYSMFKSSDRFTADVLYLYTDESENDSYEKIFSSLGEFDFHGNSYIFAVNKYSEVFECFAQLLGHPFQRPFQQNCYHVLEE